MNDKITKVLAKTDPVAHQIAGFMVTDFSTVAGTLEKLGSMEKSITYTTESTNAVVGQVGNQGGFGALHKGSSSTKASVSRSISLLKIGNSTFTDVGISSTGIFESLELGNNVGLVMSGDNKNIMYLIDYDSGVEIGAEPSFYQSWLKWIFLGIALIILWTQVASIFEGNFKAVLMLWLPVIFVLLFYSASIAYEKSKSNWNLAIDAIRTRSLLDQ